ncbi:MAG TPA: sulfatase [Planctomycetota bacterium]|nr:sulfatase [Planctomycetota bacterium]
MRRCALVVSLGFIFGALLALAEGGIIVWKSQLGFVSPTLELYAMELRYGVALGLVALLVGLALRRNRLATAVATTAGIGCAVLLGWWVNKELLDKSRIYEPISLVYSAGVLVVSFAIAWGIRWIGSRQGRVATAALLAVALGAPWLAKSSIAVHDAGAAAARKGDRTRPDVTLIIIDTLRADRLSCYGNARLTSPVLDALAGRGARFDQCIAQASWTRPSMASLHTGLFPSSHGCNDLRDALSPDAYTLAEAMHDAGYVTAGFSANENVSPTFGFSQGFDTFWNTSLQNLARFTMYGRLRHVFLKRVLHVNAEETNDDADILTDHAIAWLGAGHDAPVFTYVHYLDPHWPYDPPEYLLDGEKPKVYEYDPLLSVQSRYPFGALPEMSPEGIASGLTYYDAEIRFCDRAIGRLLAHLKSIGQLDPEDLVIVSADHGEQFYEHDSWGHGTSMFHEELHVPLIMAGGIVKPGTVHEETVRLFDVYPTILDLVGATIPHDLHALTMKPLLIGEEDASQREAFSERLSGSWEGRLISEKQGAFNWETMTSLQVGKKKIIEMRDAERPGELFYMSFDLAENPREQLRVHAAKPGEKLDRSDPAFAPDPKLVAYLKAIQEKARSHPLEKTDAHMSEDERQRLKGIGYVSGK